MKSEISVAANLGYDADDKPEIGIKISAEQYELNVSVKQEEAELFSKVRDADWDKRGSLRIGTCANAPAFWCCKDDEVSILVGEYDESWDFCVTVPASVVDEILSEIKAL